MDCAVVGCGAAAERYVADVAESPLTLTAVCDTDADRSAAFAASHGATPYDDLVSMLATEDMPLVLNLTNHAAHAPVTRQCLMADRHVWSEKPLALDPETAEGLIELAAQRDLALGCAPVSHHGRSQRQVQDVIEDGRMGPVRLAYAHAHVGRVTEWHEQPTSFLETGPLLDGAVYPLSLLVEWFGSVASVQSAAAVRLWPAGDSADPARPTHVEATLEFDDGPFCRLTASFYAPHRSREFTSLELHGDDGSCYLADAGDMGDATDPVVSFARQGRGYTSMPATTRGDGLTYLTGPERLARSVESGNPSRRSARRAHHLVEVCSQIDAVADTGGPQAVRSRVTRGSRWPTVWRPEPDVGDRSIRLPPIGFGCARYRDGGYVDRRGSIETALDAGYRLFDSAELYGNEHVIGEVLAARGSPDRESLVLTSKVWNTNHGHVAEACETTLAELGVDSLDSYLLHWPESFAYTGPLTRLMEIPVAEQEARTFPRDEDGEIKTEDRPLAAVWADLERLVDRGLTRTLGVCNVGVPTLERILADGTVPPAIVQVECHPYQPQRDLVSFCHDRGIRVVAHTPLGPDGMLSDPTLKAVADEAGLTVAEAVLSWTIHRGIVPIPSSTDSAHIVENLASAGVRLSPATVRQIDTVADAHRESATEGDG